MTSRLFKLDDIVLSVKGNAEHLLQGLTSNAMDQHLNAFLNQHGRVIATCFQEKIHEDEYLLSVPHIAVESLSKHLDRYATLNRSTIVQSDYKSYMDIDLGRILFTQENKENDISADEFILYRLDKKIPLMGIDFQVDEFILNVDEFAYVSYTKGCFLGQEPVAKVHNRSKPSRKLVVKFEDECSPEEINRMTSKIKDPAGRIKGFIFTAN